MQTIVVLWHEFYGTTAVKESCEEKWTIENERTKRNQNNKKNIQNNFSKSVYWAKANKLQEFEKKLRNSSGLGWIWSVRIQSFFCSVFYILTEYGDLQSRFSYSVQTQEIRTIHI